MKKVDYLGKLLFWLTLISPMIAFALTSMIGEASIFGVAGIIRYSWIMWLFLPIGILSIFIGIKLKKNKQHYKKNLIIASICLPLIVILGSYSLVFDNISYDTDKVIAIEDEIHLELPEQIKIATYELDSYNLSYLKINNEESNEVFKNQLESNKLWQNHLSSQIKGTLPLEVQYEVYNCDYFVFYNVTNDEYNKYPLGGEYDCIFIAYDYELQRLIILDDYKITVD